LLEKNRICQTIGPIYSELTNMEIKVDLLNYKVIIDNKFGKSIQPSSLINIYRYQYKKFHFKQKCIWWRFN